MTKRQSLVALYSDVPFGPARIKLLISYFKSAKNAWKADTKSLSKDEEKLIEILAREPLRLNEIAATSTLKVSDVSARLTVMELKGLVKNVGGGVCKKV